MAALRSWLRALDRPGLRLDLLIFALGAAVAIVLAGYAHINLNAPATLGGDHLFLLTLAKSYINGHGFRLDSQLGFPDERDWLFFPSFDLSYRIVLWLATRVTHSPFRAVHMLYVAGLTAMYGSAYWTLRRFSIRAWLAAIGALASILTPFLAARAYAHDALALSFSAPLGLGLALSIGLDRPGRGLKALFADPYVLVAVLVVGTSGLYYAFYTVMLALFAGVAAGAGQRRLSPILSAVAVSIPIFLILLFSGFGLDLPLALSPQVAEPTRAPVEQLIYGLDLATSAFPYRFVHKVAEGVAQSQAAFPAAFSAESQGEWPGPFLTLLLLATPLILAMCQMRGRGPARPQDARLQLIAFLSALVLFAVLFSARGGIGYLFNLMVSATIRADARIMPFLTFAAILLACAGAELGAGARRAWIRWGSLAAVAVVLLVTIKPQLGILHRIQVNSLALPGAQAYQRSVPAMLQAKDRAGLRTILELPVVSWAEMPPVRNFDPYSHQLAYIYDRPGSATRWSYGSNAKQHWFPLVAFEASDPAHLDNGARALGFDGALIEKSAYDAAELAALQAAIRAGGGCPLYEDDVLALYALNRGRC